MKKIFRVIDAIVTIVIVSFTMLMLVPILFHIEPNIVMSSSMYPTYNAGAVCFTDMKQTTPEVGDIVLYQLSGERITHRVVDIDENGYFITQGDNNDTVDLSPVAPEQILGKVVFWIPWLGFFIVWAKTPVGLSVIVSITVLYILVSKMVSRHKDTWN